MELDYNEEIEVKIGDTVLYQKFSGTKVKDNNDQELLLIEQTDILAVI